MSWHDLVSAQASRREGEAASLTRTPPLTSMRPWHGSILGVTNASAEHLPRGGHRNRPDPAEFLAIISAVLAA